MLMTPLWAIAMGVASLGEMLDARTITGAVATLGGVGLIAVSMGRSDTERNNRDLAEPARSQADANS